MLNITPSGSIQPCLRTVALWEASPRNKVRLSKESSLVSASSKAQEPKWGFLFIAIGRTISSNSRKSTSENFPVWPDALKFALKSIFKINSLHFLLWSPQLLLLLLIRFSCVRLCVIPEMAAHQAPPSLGFSRQEHWSGLPFPSPMHESEKWKWSHSVVSDS